MNENTEEKPVNFNPLSMGLLFFGFSLVLWESGRLTGVNVFVPWLALAISFLCGVAVFVKRLRAFLRRKGWAALLPFGMVAFFFGYFMSLLSAISKVPGVLPIAILIFGLAWVMIVFMVMSKGLPSVGQYLITALFFIPAVVYLCTSQFLSGLVLLFFAAGIFSSRWLNIESTIPL